MNKFGAHGLRMLNVSKQDLGPRKKWTVDFLALTRQYISTFLSAQPDQSPEPKLSRVELSLEPSPKPSQDEPSRAPNEVVPSRAEPDRTEP